MRSPRGLGARENDRARNHRTIDSVRGERYNAPPTICPNCKCEYIRGVTQCADCGVALVDALDEAGIPVIDQQSAGYFIFPSMRPKTEIYVSSKNLEQAKKVLLDLQAWDAPEELSEGERESLELPESDIPESDEQTSLSPDSSDHWDEDDSVAEVWSGGNEHLADTLIVCLREVGVASHKSSEAGWWRLVVRPEQEARAKEVVREVVEASPPE